MKIESPAFGYGEPIPETYSRYGRDRSPPLIFRDVPPETRTLALIVEDPDAPRGTFTHWVLFNLSPSIEGLKQGTRPMDAREGSNDWNEMGYGGPRPPSGEHRYFFRLYALDRRLDLPNGAKRVDIDRVMVGHIVAEAEWMGTFAAPVAASGQSSR